MKRFSTIGIFIFLSIIVSCSSGSRETPVEEEKLDAGIADTAPSKTIASTNYVFNLVIDRKFKGNSCTAGNILVNDGFIAYFLELPGKDNERNLSSMPKDTYSASIRTDGKKGWIIELEDVPERTNVQIHLGNYTRQDQGCILLSSKSVDINKCEVRSTANQRQGINKLQNIFNMFTRELILNQGSAKAIKIEVEITGT